VDAFGGADMVVALARNTFENAKSQQDYRFAAELLTHVVFSDPTNTEARGLQANILEQLGYQAESGPWRNFYLAAANELRVRPADGEVDLPSPDIITAPVLAAMPLDMLFDYLGIRLNGPKAAEVPVALGFNITGGIAGDPSTYTLHVCNGVLVQYPNTLDAVRTDAGYTITREGLNKLAISAATPEGLLNSGDLTVESGGLAPLNALNEPLDAFGYWFGLTTP
jgi:alkyl sulfatase BDS1-like metallo-beta-lactamase superfamily hydrolase